MLTILIGVAYSASVFELAHLCAQDITLDTTPSVRRILTKGSPFFVVPLSFCCLTCPGFQLWKRLGQLW